MTDNDNNNSDDELLLGEHANKDIEDGEHLIKNVNSTRGSVISFQNIRYVIKEAQSCSCFKKKMEKQILNNLTGILKPGMNAIMGVTGSGKTSLLDVLAGRKDPRFKSGLVLIDGNIQPANFKCISGYVQQIDFLAGSMTVRENLTFAASLKIACTDYPSRSIQEIRKNRVEQLIKELGLSSCADTYIGNEFIRGVSGGEKKRTAIGMSLVNSPSVLFLDEPTTGLDASTAYSVMNLLAQLAASGRTIIFSIHQPRYSIYKLLDYLILLDQGNMVYQGQRTEILPYFEKFGYRIEANNNPGDFILDIVTGDEKPQEGNWALDESLIDLPGYYERSDLYKKVNEEVKKICDEHNVNETSTSILGTNAETFVASFPTQILALSKRSLSNITRNPVALIGQVFVTGLIGVVIGAIYFQLKPDFQTSIFNRMGLFFFLTTNLMFSNMSALEVFINDRVLFINENASGYYRTSSFFLTKIVFDIILMRLFPVVILGCVTYWMIGLDPDPIKFGLYMLNMLLASICAASIILFASATFRVLAICNLFASLSFVIMMIFSGMIINVTSIGPWFAWLKYISVVRYTLTIFLINELKDNNFCSIVGNVTKCQSGNSYLESSGIDYKTHWDFWSLYFYNFIIYFVVTFTTYIQLRRTNKYK